MIASGGPRNTPPGTLTQLFFDALSRFDKPDALQVKIKGAYTPISTRTVGDRVRRLALGLQELGLQAGDRVAILSENRPEWAIADFACLTASIADVPLYPNLPPEQVAYIMNDAGAAAIFVSDAAQAARIAGVRAKCSTLRHVITFATERHEGADLTMAEVEARGAAVDDEARRARYRQQALTVKPDDVATLIYTSGTTGQPKGVMLTHDNLASNIAASLPAIDIKASWTALSFLPLSHSFERTVDYIYFYSGCSIAYAESVAAVAQNMQEVKPQVFVSVPRVYEKVLARVQENVATSSPTKQKIFSWAQGVARKALPWRLKRTRPPGLLGIQLGLADKLV